MHCPSRLVLTTPGSIVDQRGLTSARIRVCFRACVYSVYARVHLFCLVCVVCVPLLGTPIDLLPPSLAPRFDCLIAIHTYSVLRTRYGVHWVSFQASVDAPDWPAHHGSSQFCYPNCTKVLIPPPPAAHHYYHIDHRSPTTPRSISCGTTHPLGHNPQTQPSPASVPEAPANTERRRERGRRREETD